MKAAVLNQLLADREAKRPVILATNLETGQAELIYPGGGSDALGEAAEKAARSDKGRIVEVGGERIFLNAFNPPLRMIIVGAVHIAQPLTRMAVLAGYDVTVIDPRRAFASEDRFPGVGLLHDWPDEAMVELKPDRRTAVVTLTHDPKLDDPALAEALRSEAFYIGALGSNRTHGKRKERLQEEGFTDPEMARIHGPVGLDIGAKSPAEIAVSIMAEVTTALRNGAA